MLALLASGLVAALLLVVALINLLVYGALLVVSKFHERTRQTKALQSLDLKLRKPPSAESAKGRLRRRLYKRDDLKATDLPRLAVQRMHRCCWSSESVERRRERR